MAGEGIAASASRPPAPRTIVVLETGLEPPSGYSVSLTPPVVSPVRPANAVKAPVPRELFGAGLTSIIELGPAGPVELLFSAPSWTGPLASWAKPGGVGSPGA